MKKWLLIGSLVMVIGLLAVAVAIPALAQGPETPFAPKTGVAPGWVDEDGDGVCDYAGAGHRGGRAMRGGWHHSSEGGMITVAADLLGMTPQELLTELQEGKTLLAVAEEHGVTAEQLVDAFIAVRAERLQAAVDAGRLTQEQADLMLQHMRENALERLEEGFCGHGPGVTGTFGQGFRGHGRWFADADGDGQPDHAPAWGMKGRGHSGRWANGQ